MTNWDFLSAELATLKRDGLLVHTRTVESAQGAWITVDGKRVLNLCANNYLGLANHPRLREAAHAAIERFGVGPAAMRSIVGTLSLHHELEQKLAVFKGVEATLTLQSGFNANLAVIPALVQEDDAIFSDELNHASIIDGCRLSRAQVIRYRHCDPDDLSAALTRTQGVRRRLVITDGVFSMDGEIAPLPQIVAVAAQHEALVMVDDAHGEGVLGLGGRGISHHFGLLGHVDVEVGTLSKAFGVIGGYVAGRQVLIDYLKQRARPYLFQRSAKKLMQSSDDSGYDRRQSHSSQGGDDTMPYRWPEDTIFTRLDLPVEERWCRTCGCKLTVCDHRHRRLFTLNGPVHAVCKLAHCPQRVCPAHTRTLSPEAETALAMPWWALGWDVVCWLGHRRFARHWSVGQLRTELADTYQIRLSDDAIERYIRRYQQMLAARQHDPHLLAAAYADVDAVILAIDGLQPEKGHETLYVVRELERKRVWFAEALLSSAAVEVQQLLAQARHWAERLGKPVRLWMSDKQEAFVRGIAAEFPGVPHRYCANHFLRDVAEPVLDADSRAKVQMRRKVRGLRTIEREVLAARRPSEPPLLREAPSEASQADVVQADEETQEVVLDYCAAVRGILNDDQGGPLHPPGLRMAEALGDVHASLQRNLEAKKGGLLTSV